MQKKTRYAALMTWAVLSMACVGVEPGAEDAAELMLRHCGDGVCRGHEACDNCAVDCGSCAAGADAGYESPPDAGSTPPLTGSVSHPHAPRGGPSSSDTRIRRDLAAAGPKQPCRIRYRLRESDAARPIVEEAHRDEPVPDTAPTPQRIRIEHDLVLCQGHAACMGEAPEVFDVDKKGKTTVLNTTPGTELYEKVRAAARYCPNGAIRIVEEE